MPKLYAISKLIDSLNRETDMILIDNFELGTHSILDAKTGETICMGTHSQVTCALRTLLKYIQKGKQK